MIKVAAFRVGDKDTVGELREGWVVTVWEVTGLYTPIHARLAGVSYFVFHMAVLWTIIRIIFMVNLVLITILVLMNCMNVLGGRKGCAEAAVTVPTSHIAHWGKAVEELFTHMGLAGALTTSWWTTNWAVMVVVNGATMTMNAMNEGAVKELGILAKALMDMTSTPKMHQARRDLQEAVGCANVVRCVSMIMEDTKGITGSFKVIKGARGDVMCIVGTGMEPLIADLPSQTGSSYVDTFALSPMKRGGPVHHRRRGT